MGVKVRTALAAAHGQGGQAVLEGLLEAQELQDALIDRGMEAQAALVGADGAVELHAVAAVHLHLTGIVHPRHTEGDDALRLHQALDQTSLLVLGVLFHNGLDALQHLAHSLQKLGLVGVALFQTLVNTLQVFIRQHNRILLFPNYSINLKKRKCLCPPHSGDILADAGRFRFSMLAWHARISGQCLLYYYKALRWVLQ